MTKSIGKGIVNVPVPVTEEESSIWGKLALKTDRAKAALIREAMLIGLWKIAPELADDVKQIRLLRRLKVGEAMRSLIRIPVSLLRRQDRLKEDRDFASLC